MKNFLKKKMRLDEYLVENEYFENLDVAQRQIMIGNVIINEQKIEKAGEIINIEKIKSIRIKEKDIPYVSRGGLKLEKAIKEFNLDFENKIVMDVGASTGGFTDCALQNGAKRVYANDVGTNQLDWKLRNDERVVSLEEKHIKDLEIEDLENNKVDFIVIDVSFISLTKVIIYFDKFLKTDGKAVMLIKPQFEVGKEKIGRNGIVENEEYHDEAIKKIIYFIKDLGYELIGVEDSPIKGTKGNKEFLMLMENKCR